MIKSRRVSWAGPVERLVGRELYIEYWWETRRKKTTRKSKT
jgi:hypothetical protein